MDLSTSAPCPQQCHLLCMVNPSLLHRDSTRTTSDGQGWSISFIKINTDLLSQHCPTPTPKYVLPTAALLKTVEIGMAAVRAWAILDSGVISHFLMTAAPMTNMRPTNKPIFTRLPTGEHVHSTHMRMLDIPALPAAAQHAHIIPSLTSYSLIFAVTLCNAGCNVAFTKIGCTITYHGKIILYNSKCTCTGLWITPSAPRHHQPPASTQPSHLPSSLLPTWKPLHLLVNMQATSTRPFALLWQLCLYRP
jgi:hypothetical protein